MLDFRELAALRRHVTIRHHIPGRIRLCFDVRLAARAAPLLQASAGRNPPPAITGVRLNPMARSVVVEYDPAALVPETIEEMLTTSDDERAANLAENLAAKLTDELSPNTQ